jgi:hypothetical protein
LASLVVLMAQDVGTRVQLWAFNNNFSFIYGADGDEESRVLWAAGHRYAWFLLVWVLRLWGRVGYIRCWLSSLFLGGLILQGSIGLSYFFLYYLILFLFLGSIQVLGNH